MVQLRSHGAVHPGIEWGPFTLRIPFVHVGVEIPELIQGLLVAGATGLSIVPLYMEWWGMSFETAVAMCIVSSVVVCAGPIVFGDPYCAGWLTPALPLVLRQTMEYETVPERTAFVTAVVLLVALTFLLMGVSGLGNWFLRAVPRALKAGIILGAGMSAVYGEFIPRSGASPSRIEALPVCILLAVCVSLLLLFSEPIERWKKRYRGVAFLGALGIAPGFFAAMVVGPWVGEVSYRGFQSYFVDAETGQWIFNPGDIFFLPEFGTLLSGFSPLYQGLPSLEFFAAALPLAVAAYVIGFGDIITGTAIVGDAARERPDEHVPIDERRTHLTIGCRNLLMAVLAGPFFPLQGPLWTGATVVVAERYRRGRKEMDSIFGGIFSYLMFGIPIFYFIRPLLELFRPVLDVAFSLTLILTGFACAYVALAMPRDRIERGLIVLIGMVIMYFPTSVGLLVGFAASAALLGRRAWESEPEEGGSGDA